MKFITNKISIKAEEKLNDANDVYVGKHSFQDAFHHGTKDDFANHENLFEQPLMGPFKHESEAGIPTQHVSSLRPNHGPEFDKIINNIVQEKGNPMVVGGFPRDHVLGKESKDKDIEVYGMPAEKLQKILSKYGHVNAVGSSFGVIKLKTPDGQDYDFSLPRRENKEGQGYKGFQVQTDHAMTPQEAASRRDFTFNALMQDPTTGKIHDYYNGLSDLKNKVLRATSERYAEDPLRVLRGMQFAGRMGLDMDPDTAKMSESLLNEYPTLTKDRIMTEWMKLAEKSEIPSKGLKVLEDTKWLSQYPELDLSPQNMQTVDNIVKVFKDKSPEDKNALFFSALTHSMNRPEIESFLDRIGLPLDLQKRVLALKMGMDSPHLRTGETFDDSNVRNTSFHTSPESIDNLMHVLGAKGGDYEKFHNRAKELGVNQKPPQPIVTGKFLQTLGVKPGPEMGQKIKEAYQAQLDGKINSPEEAVDFLGLK